MSRSREFDKEEVINKAMNIFWSKGYDGTSLKDLTEATGLLKGSLYNAFESKENLFLLCLENYSQYSSAFYYRQGDPAEYLKKFFKRLVKDGVSKDFTKGCLVMNSCLEFSDEESMPAKRTRALFNATELNFENVINALIQDETRDKQKLKVSLITAAFSIREISKFKKERTFLKQIANNALRDFDLSI